MRRVTLALVTKAAALNVMPVLTLPLVQPVVHVAQSGLIRPLVLLVARPAPLVRMLALQAPRCAQPVQSAVMLPLVRLHALAAQLALTRHLLDRRVV